MIAANLFVAVVCALLAALAVLAIRQHQHLPVQHAAATMVGVSLGILVAFSLLIFAGRGMRRTREQRG